MGADPCITPSAPCSKYASTTSGDYRRERREYPILTWHTKRDHQAASRKKSYLFDQIYHNYLPVTFRYAHSAAYLTGFYTLQWRHNYRDGISNHLRLDCLLNRLFRRISKKTSKLRVTGLGEGNSLVTGEFPAQRASKAENVSIWWRHHEIFKALGDISVRGYQFWLLRQIILLDFP